MSQQMFPGGGQPTGPSYGPDPSNGPSYGPDPSNGPSYGPDPSNGPSYGQGVSNGQSPSYGPSYGQGPADSAGGPRYTPPPPPPPAPPARPASVLPVPVAVVPVPGTPFGVAILGVSPTSSGPATASLVTGVGSILVSLVVGCFGVLGARPGWGPMVSGAFAILATLLGLAALALARTGLRQIRRAVPPGGATGRGLAMAGLICGAVGVFLTLASFVASLALTATR